MMPGIARKVLVCAAIDGLILQPLSSKGQRPYQPIKIRYGDSSISTASREHLPDPSGPDSSFEAFGVIGLITVSRLSYLITITRRQQVAQILGSPVYVVTGVAITPCSAKQEADESIRRTAILLKKDTPESDDSNVDGETSDEDVENCASLDEVEEALIDGHGVRPTSSRSSVAEDVMRRRGSYGRFTQRWFSKSGWTMDQRRSLGLSLSAAESPADQVEDAPSAAKISLEEEIQAKNRPTELLPKLLRTMQIFFGSSKSFYYSHDIDITRSPLHQSVHANQDANLHSQVDSQFFWNRHIMDDFIQNGHDSLVMPILQGFIGQRTFTVDRDPPQKDEAATESVELANMSAPDSIPAPPQAGPARDSLDLRPSEKKYLITLISRRSIQRAGLRYLRRGINEDGYTANMVETEQVLSSPTWDSSTPIHSFVQIRGSIPLFYTQSAYSLKPVPVIQHGTESNFKACGRHFERLGANYGALQIVNLVEKKGVEEPIGSLYQTNIERLNEELGAQDKIPFEWFDFHHACRGMKFENVSRLLNILKGKLEELGSTTRINGEVTQRQAGVLRTNCMDCLDRTNVCQSSFAKHMLDLQLKADGFDTSAQVDQETRWFNTLWADNGDAVSKQYASTAAMKGDYTRTRKRDYRGALNDLGLSLARFYSGMVNDYFSQAAIDFLLGNVTEKVFDEFESDMMTKDPAVSVANMRQRAIELCHKRVVADADEEMQGGWALISPNTANAVKSWPMEEAVLLLTDSALYLCRFNWDLDKVSSFDRVHLANVTHIKFGTYITSTMAPAHMDEMKNVGFVISYQPGKSNVKRTNTRTLSTSGDVAPGSSPKNKDEKAQRGLAGFFSPKARARAPDTQRLAFKVPYVDSSTAVAGAGGGVQPTELQQVATICAETERLALEAQRRKGGIRVEKGDIISLQEARRNTGLLEQLGHSIKKLVWA